MPASSRARDRKPTIAEASHHRSARAHRLTTPALARQPGARTASTGTAAGMSMNPSALLGAKGPGVFFRNRGGELPGDGRELAERASDRRKADPLQRLAEILPISVELGPKLRG